MNWNIIIISFSVLLAAFAVFKEVRRPNRARLMLRILSVIVAIATLALLALPLIYQKAIKESANAKLIVLTQGFDADSLKAYPDVPVCTFDSAVNKNYPKASLVTDIREAAADANERQLHILGYGLTDDDLSGLNKNFVFHPSAQPDGLTAVHWTSQLTTGDKLQVQGSIKNSSDKPVLLALNGLGSTLDSVKIPANTSQTFTLNTTPKQTGKAVYHLTGLSKNDTLFNELLPVTVTQAAQVRLLLLSSSPNFESNFFKNWLSANGYVVASRSLISKGKYSQEAVNMPKADLNHITGGLLQKFDLVVCDVPSINNLSPAESSVLQHEVSGKGLGLIIRADSADKLNNWATRNFALGRIAGRPAAGLLQIAGKGYSSSKISFPSAYINTNTNQQRLLSDAQGRSFVVNALNGAGKIGLTLINNSYNWMLEGNKTDYAALWSAVINKTARRQTAESAAWVSPQFATVGETTNIITAGAPSVNGIPVASLQNPNIPFEQLATYWPEKMGWQETQVAGSKPYWWFAWPKSGWLSIKAAHKLSTTKAFAAAHPLNTTVTKQIQQFETAQVPKIYFYILFLVAAAFLWAEAKYSGY